MTEGDAASHTAQLLLRHASAAEACADSESGWTLDLAERCALPPPLSHLAARLRFLDGTASQRLFLDGTASQRLVDGAEQQRWVRVDAAGNALDANALVLDDAPPFLDATVCSVPQENTLPSTAELRAMKERWHAECCALGFELVRGEVCSSLQHRSVRTREHEAVSTVTRCAGHFQARPLHERETVLDEGFQASNAAGLLQAGLDALQRMAVRCAQDRGALPDIVSLVLMPEAVESCALPWMLRGEVQLPSTHQLLDDPASAAGFVHSIDRVGRTLERHRCNDANGTQHWIGRADEPPRKGLIAPSIEGPTQPLHTWAHAAVLFAARASTLIGAAAGSPSAATELVLRVDEGLLCLPHKRKRCSGILRLKVGSIQGVSEERLRLPSAALLPALLMGEATRLKNGAP